MPGADLTHGTVRCQVLTSVLTVGMPLPFAIRSDVIQHSIALRDEMFALLTLEMSACQAGKTSVKNALMADDNTSPKIQVPVLCSDVFPAW